MINVIESNGKSAKISMVFSIDMDTKKALEWLCKRLELKTVEETIDLAIKTLFWLEKKKEEGIKWSIRLAPPGERVEYLESHESLPQRIKETANVQQ